MHFAHTPIERLADSVPLYLQIAEALMNRIESGELAHGDRLPSERQLSRALGVNRTTLRRALYILEQRGMLERRQGEGTFVTQPKLERQADRVYRFTRGVQARGLHPGAQVIQFERRLAPSSLARQLRIPVSAPIYYLVRLRTIDEEPVLIERYSIPIALAPDLERFNLGYRSVLEVLAQEYGVVIQRARQSLEPVLAGPWEAEILGIEAGAPLMLETRLSFDAHGRPVEHGSDLYRGDRFRFVTESAPYES
jgi:GntR family transcriptional regulator